MVELVWLMPAGKELDQTEGKTWLLMSKKYELFSFFSAELGVIGNFSWQFF